MRPWLLALAFLLALLALGLLLAPERTVVEREIRIGAPPGAVHELLADFDHWQRWSSMLAGSDERRVEVTLGEPTGGVGATAEVTADGVHLRLTMVESQPGRGVEIETLATESAAESATVGFRSTDEIGIEPVPAGSRVTWRRRGSAVESPLVRLLDAVVTRHMVARQLERELSGLRRALTGGGPAP